jgi:peptidoglycan/LPS O-acetylase OafA/YrhL
MSDTFLIFVGAAVSLAGSIVVAVLSYKYFELPFLRLKNRFGGYQSELNKTLIK